MKTSKNPEGTHHLLDMLMMYCFGLMATCIPSAFWRERIFFVGLTLGTVIGIVQLSMRFFRGGLKNGEISN
jgi:hypothetical protein